MTRRGRRGRLQRVQAIFDTLEYNQNTDSEHDRYVDRWHVRTPFVAEGTHNVVFSAPSHVPTNHIQYDMDS